MSFASISMSSSLHAHVDAPTKAKRARKCAEVTPLLALQQSPPTPENHAPLADQVSDSEVGQALLRFFDFHDRSSNTIWFPGSSLRGNAQENPIQPEETILAQRLQDRNWHVLNFRSWIPRLQLDPRSSKILEFWLGSLYIRQRAHELRQSNPRFSKISVVMAPPYQALAFYELGPKEREIIRKWRSMGIDSTLQQYRERWKKEDEKARLQAAAKTQNIEFTAAELRLADDIYAFLKAQEQGDDNDQRNGRRSFWTPYFFPGQKGIYRPRWSPSPQPEEMAFAKHLEAAHWNQENYSSLWRSAFQKDPRKLQFMDEVMAFLSLKDTKQRLLKRIEMGFRIQLREDHPLQFPRPTAVFSKANQRMSQLESIETALEQGLRSQNILKVSNALSWPLSDFEPDVHTAIIWFGLSKLPLRSPSPNAEYAEHVRDRNIIQAFYYPQGESIRP